MNIRLNALLDEFGRMNSAASCLKEELQFILTQKRDK